jgi:hypothetical protein
MTVRTRDDRDVIDAQLAFHLAAGVDFVIANDHRSVDGTRELLEEYERRGVLHLLRRDAEFVVGEWVDEMARLAATDFEADWVFHTDADEFWWPRGGNIADVLAAVPSRFGVVRGLWRHFAARPDDGSHFAERMIARLASRNRWMGVEHTFHPNVKVAHRADPATRVRRGNHDAFAAGPVLRSWAPFEVFHFPLRTSLQAEAKYQAWRPVLDGGTYVASHVDAAVDALRNGTFEAFYDHYVVEGDALEGGLTDGTLSLDTRLRDALRTLAGDANAQVHADTRFDPVDLPRGALDFPALGLREAAALADDVMQLADAAERARERVEDLEQRLAVVEGPWGRR